MNAPPPDFRRCLSIWQPWASLIIRPDLAPGPEREAWMASKDRKDVENRTWGTSYRGPLYIHAGLRIDTEAIPGLTLAFPWLEPLLHRADFMVRGGIIGVVQLVDVVQYHRSVWYSGNHAWVMEKPRALPFEPLRGMQGLFRAGDVPPLPAKAQADLFDESQKELL